MPDDPQKPDVCCHRARARVVLVLFALVAAAGAALALSPWASGFADKPSRGAGDVDLYRAKVARIAGGEGYYQAAGAELTARGYPTHSVFNWRTPLPIWLLGQLPSLAWGKVILGGLALASLMLAFAMLEKECSLAAGVVGVAFLSGALLPCLLGDLLVMPVLWSGVCILLSVAAYGTDRPRLGMAAGIAALFLRELAAPYCLVAVVLAARQRDWREVRAWCGCFAVYGLYYLLHAWQVSTWRAAEVEIAGGSWIQLGGAAFVIATSQMNAYLLLLPQWCTAIYLAVALVGFARWNTAAGQRAGISACLLLACMAIAGHDYNQYWGSLFAPLLCLGAARGAVELPRLWAEASVFSRDVPRVATT